MTCIGDLLAEYKELPVAKSAAPVLTLTEKNGFIRQADRFHKRLATEDTSKYKVVRKDDIAFNPYLLWAGAVAQNTIVDEGIISPLYPTFKVREGHDPRYVARLLLAPQVITAYDSIAFGSVPRRRRTSTKDFLELGIPTPPPIDEQRRIAAILDHADGLRVKRRRAIAQLGDLAESIFLDLFSEDAADAVSFDSVVTNFRNGLSPAKAGTVMADVLTLSAVTQGIFDPTAVKTSTFMAAPPAAMRVSGDDFLICRGNGNLNLVGVGVSPGHDHPDLTFPDTVIAASFDAAVVDPVYLEMAWKRPSVRRQIESVARTTNGTYKINQQSLGAVRIVIPPLSEQQEFARRIGAIPNPDLGEMDELFQSLQSRAFSGQL